MNRMIEHYFIYCSIKNYFGTIVDADLMEFLVVTSDANLEMYVVNWCKIFGAKRNNKLHFSSFISKEDYYIELQNNGISIERFEKYTEEMKCFRDKYISHSDNYNSVVPCLDISLKALFVLDMIIKTTIKFDDNMPLEDLFGNSESYYEVSKNKYKYVLEKLIEGN